MTYHLCRVVVERVWDFRLAWDYPCHFAYFQVFRFCITSFLFGRLSLSGDRLMLVSSPGRSPSRQHVILFRLLTHATCAYFFLSVLFPSPILSLWDCLLLVYLLA